MGTTFFETHGKDLSVPVDSSNLFLSLAHREALNNLIQGMRSHTGIVLLIGEIGTGKTTLCHYLQTLPDFNFIYINNPFFTRREFLRRICGELKVPTCDASFPGLMQILQDRLTVENPSDRQPVLLVDDAHAVSLTVLELLSFLCGLQPSGDQLLQLVLVAQPKLLDVLRHPRLASFDQRIGMRYHLRGMDLSDTLGYVAHRLEKPGYRGKLCFSRRALALVWKASRGIPRLIDHICGLALIRVSPRGKKKIGQRELRKLITDPDYRSLFDRYLRIRLVKRAFAALTVILCVSACVAVYYLGLGGTHFLEVATKANNSRIKAQSVENAGMERRRFVRAPVILPKLSEETENAQAGGTSSGEINGPSAIALSEATPISSSHKTPAQRVSTSANQLRSPVEATDEVFVGSIHSLSDSGATAAQDSPEEEVEITKGLSRSVANAKLNAIAWNEEPTKRFVVLDEQVLHERDFFGDGQVLSIYPDHVELLHGHERLIKTMRTYRGEKHIHGAPDSVDMHPGFSNYDTGTDETRQEPAGNLRTSILKTVVNFGSDSTALPDKALQVLEETLRVANRYPSCTVHIKGYTDNVGAKKHNKLLSEGRAKVVKEYFIRRGMSRDKMRATGMGEMFPLMPNTTAEARAVNRRVEIVLAVSENH
jgi:type II secretory pathway predicted ATPase ExeA/outer membrane protein OmpA-like peptidoglycan-associated protein